MKATVSGAVIALSITSFATVGTANAATPTHADAVPSALQNPPHPPPPPHRFRMRFKSQQECRARADHDHHGKQADWDCRRGPDRNNPWEYWGN